MLNYSSWSRQHQSVISLIALVITMMTGISGWCGAEENGLYRKAPLGSELAKLPAALIPVIEDQRAGVTTSATRLARARHAQVSTANPTTWQMHIDGLVTPQLLADITATGAIIASSSERWQSISVVATLDQINALIKIPGVRRMGLQSKPRVRSSGTVTSTADTGLKADLARSTHGVSGAGVKIGVISDSIRSTAAMLAKGSITGAVPNAVMTGTTPQLSGDLPTSIQIVAADVGFGGTDEGEGMLELIHDVAPGAPLAFAAVGASEIDFANRILALSAAGCAIIVDDIGFLDEATFQDGPIAQAINTVTGQGKLYFSAAGNSGSTGILSTYQDISATNGAHSATSPPDGQDFHNWGISGSDLTPAFLPLVVAARSSVTIMLRWNQPYADFGLGRGSQIDLDLLLYSGASTTSTILAVGGDAQGTTGFPSGNPIEILDFTNSSLTSQTVFLAVDHFSGPDGFRMSVIIDGRFTTPFPSVFNGPTIFGHPTALGANSVGAIFSGSLATPTVKGPFGGDPTSLCAETFSSQGGQGSNGMEFYFDTSGNPLAGAPQRRNKPDLAAPDGSQTLIFGNIVSSVNASFPSFFGTSAAAPHAAAVAALAWEGATNFTNAQIRARLQNSALDVVASSPLSAVGPDEFTGFGLVDPQGAIAPRPRQVSTSLAAGTYPRGDVPISVTFSGSISVTGSPSLALNTIPARSARFVSVSGSTMNFLYTIVAGDVATNLDVASTAALSLNGGTISNGVGSALITLPTGSLSSAGVAVGLPSLALSITGSPIVGNSADVTFTLSSVENLLSPDFSKLTITNGIRGTVTGVGTTTIRIPVTAINAGTVTLTAAPGFLQDALGTLSASATASVTFDNVLPILTLNTSSDVVRAGNFLVITLTFSKPVTGVTNTSVLVTGGSLTSLSGASGSSVYSASILAGNSTALTLTVDPNAISDQAGNHLGIPPVATVTITGADLTNNATADSSGGGSGGCGLGGTAFFSGTLFLLIRHRRQRVG